MDSQTVLNFSIKLNKYNKDKATNCTLTIETYRMILNKRLFFNQLT